MTVAIAEKYLVGCADCRTHIENIVTSAIRDRTVTGVRLVRADTCDHEAAKKLLQARGAKPSTRLSGAQALAGQQELPGVAAESLPNGIDATM